MFLLINDTSDQTAYIWLTLNETMKLIIVLQHEIKMTHVVYNEAPTDLFEYDTIGNHPMKSGTI